MEKTKNMGVSNSNPFTGKYSPGDKHSRLEWAIHFYEVEDNDKSNIGDEEVIHFKIDKALSATNQNIKKMTFQVITYFDHQGLKVIHVLRDMRVIIFEHLGITI